MFGSGGVFFPTRVYIYHPASNVYPLNIWANFTRWQKMVEAFLKTVYDEATDARGRFTRSAADLRGFAPPARAPLPRVGRGAGGK
jgi:hypothetical protein